MAIIIPTLPTLGGPSSTEDADVRNALQTIVNEVNGQLNKDNLAAAAGILYSQLGKDAAGPGVGAFSAYRSIDQSIAAGAPVKLAYQTEEFDLSGWYDSAASSYIPLVKGIYRVSAACKVADGSPFATDGRYLKLLLYKNGALHRRLGAVWVGAAGAIPSLVGSALVEANGVDDDFDVRVEHNDSSNRIFEGSPASCFFQGELVAVRS